jgi:hypothetical protein
MQRISTSVTNTLTKRLFRIFVIASVLFATQTVGRAPKVEARTLANVYEAVSVAVSYDLGSKVCGIGCGAAAAAATVVVNSNAANAANATVNATRSRLQDVFGFWGFH